MLPLKFGQYLSRFHQQIVPLNTQPRSFRWSPLLGSHTFLWPHHHTACEILVSNQGVNPGFSAVKVLSPNHWTSREFPRKPSLTLSSTYFSSSALNLFQFKCPDLLPVILSIIHTTTAVACTHYPPKACEFLMYSDLALNYVSNPSTHHDDLAQHFLDQHLTR